MVTGGVKKTRTERNTAHKNNDKTGFTVLTFRQRPRVSGGGGEGGSEGAREGGRR